MTVGSVECPECGLKAETVATPTLLKMARGWMVDGQVPPATRWCANGHEWSFRSHSRLVRAGGWRRTARGGAVWWLAPGRWMRVLHYRRNAEPVPLTYFIAMVVGAGLGVLLDWWLGWSWWAVMVGFVILVWGVFLSSGFFGPGRVDLLADLVAVRRPDRAAALRARTLARLAEQALFPIYGLPGSWTGPRSFGGYGGSRNLRHLVLVHGEPEEGPFVVVDSSRVADGDRIADHMKRSLGRSLYSRHLEPPAFDSPQQRNDWLDDRHRLFDQWDLTPWEEILISVDGTPRPFQQRTEGNHWVAVGFLDHTVVGLDGGGFPPDQVNLATIGDFEVYARGSTEQLRHEGQ